MASYLNLNPTGALASTAYATGGGQQVGQAGFATGNHAALWSGSAASFIDLNPAGGLTSIATGTDGAHQAGAALFRIGTGEYAHAGIWSGSAASFQDLSPSPTTSCGITAMGGGQEVGQFDVPGQGTHAAIWSGTAASMVDVHPFPGFSSSLLLATIGWAQVGWSHVPGGGFPHAGLWFGTAESFVDLQQFLPAGFYNSEATCIEFYNGQLSIGGWAIAPDGSSHAFLWTGVPAPGTPATLGLAFALLGRRRRQGRDD